MRVLPLAPFGLAFLLAACGGGGGGGAAGAGALLKGNVRSVNGQSLDVSGVRLSSSSTGALDMSGADGAFDLGRIPAGTERLRVRTEHGLEVEVEVEIEDGARIELHLSVHDDHVDEVDEDTCDDHGGHSEARARLTAVEAGLEGHVRVRASSSLEQGFDVEAEHLAALRRVDVVVIDPATGSEELQATLAANGLGEAELELRTNDGDRLPFGATDVADLAEFRVQVRDAATGAVLLQGEVPALGALPDCTGGGPGDDDSSGEARLTNQGVVRGTAEVELRSRPERGEEKIEVSVHGTNAVGVLEVWLEDPANAGTLSKVGVLQASGDGQELERDTEDGETLPYGVAAAADLVGLRIEVRRASDGAVLFAGTTPPVRND
jgi:hypothetical protein